MFLGRMKKPGVVLVDEPEVEVAVCSFDGEIVTTAKGAIDPDAKGITVERLIETKKMLDSMTHEPPVMMVPRSAIQKYIDSGEIKVIGDKDGVPIWNMSGLRVVDEMPKFDEGDQSLE